jgi:hypothetical protein
MATFVWSAVYEAILFGKDDVPYGLYDLHIAFAEQICRLRYEPTSLTYAKEKLLELKRAEYIQAGIVPTMTHGAPHYYAMGPKGMAYAERIGYDVKDSWRPSQEQRESYAYFKHTMEVNDVLISAMLLHKADPRFMLESLKHERYLHHHPRTFTWNGTKFKVVPDGVLKFRTPEGPRMVLLEHETWSRHQRKFREKVRKYIAMLQTERVPIIFTTFRGDEHVRHMREWTLEELTVQHQPQAIGVYFRFTSLEQPPNPVTVWLSARWQTPYDQAPESALAA